MGRRKDPDKLSDALIQQLKGVARRVNKTLPNYEQDYVSATRTTDVTDKEPCKSLKEFVEIRFNRECMEIPELRDAVMKSNGHLFVCRELVDANPKTRRFSQALVTLIDESDIDNEIDKILEKKDDINLGVKQFRELYPTVVDELKSSLIEGMTLARSVLKGCTKYKFNSVGDKVKLTNEFNKKL